MVARSVVLKGLAVVVGLVVLLGVAAGGLVATGALAKPTVQSTSYSWGEVTNETTVVETDVTVSNPNPVGIPGLLDIQYTATLNDVTLLDDTVSNVGFGTGTSTVETSAEMQNARIADWWVTHVNNGEQSSLDIEATVSGPGISRTIPARSSTIETDILGGFTADGERTVDLAGEPFVVLSDQQASWGEATDEATPMRFTATVENVHDYPVTLDGVEYVVEMNGVELGQGTQRTNFDVQPGETQTLDVTAELDTPKMARWWAAHVRDDEVSNLTVRMYGVVERDGEQVRIPLRLYETTLRLETDLLGDGGTSVEPVASSDGPPATGVEVTDRTRSWGEVTDETTELRTSVALDTPDGPLADLLRMDVEQTVAINDVTVADAETTVSDIDRGSDTLTIPTRLDNAKVPQWWARHLNRGEQSTIDASPSATVDVGATTVDVDLATPTQTVETDMLAGMNGRPDEEIESGGRTVATIERTQAEWGEATTRTAPLRTSTTIQNEVPTTLEVTDVRYTVSINDVALADRTADASYVIAPGERKTLDLTMELDNSKMDEWWVTHVRNDEQSNFDVTVTARVESQFGSERVTLDSLGQSGTVETSIVDSE